MAEFTSSSRVHTPALDAIQQLSVPLNDHKEPLTRLWNGLLTVLIALVAEFLIAGLSLALDQGKSDFPPSILAMMIVFLAIYLCGLIIPGVENFYRKHLLSPADLLNRHMSIGFTVPFVMICRSPAADAHTIGLIIICFLLTGILNAVSTYFLALPIQFLMIRWDKCTPAGNDESGDFQVLEGQRFPQGRLAVKDDTKTDSMFSSLTGLGLPLCASNEKKTATEGSQSLGNDDITTTQTRQARLCNWISNNPMIIMCWSLTIIVGLPLRYSAGNDAVLATGLLCATWFSMLEIQGAVKRNKQLRPGVRTVVAALSNAVLWTSIVMIAYVFIDAAISGRPLLTMLDTLQTNTSFSSFIRENPTGVVAQDGTKQPRSMGAGDVAQSILNAGLVSWGLKLYEYRHQLLSRAGLTVVGVSSILALGNVALGPLCTKALGLFPASRALAFATRGVTIALGSPVMKILGGDAGLNAAMVVISGIMFQMGLGLGVGSWLEKQLAFVQTRPCTRNGEESRTVPTSAWASSPVRPEVIITTVSTRIVTDRREGEEYLQGEETETRIQAVPPTLPPIVIPGPVVLAPSRSGDVDLESQSGSSDGSSRPSTPGNSTGENATSRTQRYCCDRHRANSPQTVAAGVTVGINSAAMGTAYLYESKSESAPYSALSMMALGIMSVAFASIPLLAEWIKARVGTP